MPFASTESPRAYPSAASCTQTSIPGPLTTCSPHVAVLRVSNLSLPPAALTAARFRHPPRSSVATASYSRLLDSLHIRPPKLRATELPSRFRRSYARRGSQPPWFRMAMIACLAGHLICTMSVCPNCIIIMSVASVWYPRAPALSAAVHWAWLSATDLYLTFRHAGVYLRDRKWSNLSWSIATCVS